MIVSELLGWIGAFCFGICAIPQAWKSYRLKNSHEMTWFFLWLWLGGEVFYMASMLVANPIGWLMFNVCANTSCLLVILYYKAFPKRWNNGR